MIFHTFREFLLNSVFKRDQIIREKRTAPTHLMASKGRKGRTQMLSSSPEKGTFDETANHTVPIIYPNITDKKQPVNEIKNPCRRLRPKVENAPESAADGMYERTKPPVGERICPIPLMPPPKTGNPMTPAATKTAADTVPRTPPNTHAAVITAKLHNERGTGPIGRVKGETTHKTAAKSEHRTISRTEKNLPAIIFSLRSDATGWDLLPLPF